MATAKISVSNLYVIMGRNYFKNFDKILASSWRSYDRESYNEWEKRATSDGSVSKVSSNAKQLDHIQKKMKIDITKELAMCKSTICSKDLNIKKDAIIKTLTRNLSTEAERQEITNLVNSETNTSFGIRHENTAIVEFQKQTNTEVIGQQKRFNNSLGVYNNIEWILVGLIDGLTKNNEIVEIKNRVGSPNKTSTLRHYEEPQIMTYMWLSKSASGYMVENYKSKDGNVLNIIPVSYQVNYFEENVIPAIQKFIQFFNIFMNSDDMKMKLMKGGEAELYQAYQELKI